MPEYDWLEEYVLDESKAAGIVTLTIARIGDEAYLNAVGAQEPFESTTGVPLMGHVGVTQALNRKGEPISGVVLGAEFHGLASYQAAARISEPDGEAMSFHYNCGQDWFTWARAGKVLAEFSWWLGMGHDMETAMGGDDLPAVADRICRLQLGLDPYDSTDDPCAAAATLMTATFGAAITSQLLDNAVFTSGSVEAVR